MGTRSENEGTFTGQVRRAQLVGCAVQALGEVGFAGTSIAEIARRAGVSKGVVTYHFASKEELLFAVVADLYTRGGEVIGEVTSTAGSALDLVRGYVKANLEFVRAHPQQVRAVVEIAANLRRKDGNLALAPAGQDPVRDHLHTLLQTGQDKGELGQFDPAAVALIIRAAIDTAAAQLVTNPSFDLNTYSQQLVSMVESAVSNPT